MATVDLITSSALGERKIRKGYAWAEGMCIVNRPIQENLPLTPTPWQRTFSVQSHTYPRTRMTVSVSFAPSQWLLTPSLYV